MALPIRSIVAPLLSALLAIASTPIVSISGAVWASEPPRPGNHQNTNAGSRLAPSYQPREQQREPRAPAPAGPAPSHGGRGGGAPAPGGQAWNRPAQIDGARGGPAWHAVPANGARGQANGNTNYGYSGNARPDYTQPNYARPAFTRPSNGNANSARAESIRPNYRQPNSGQPGSRPPDYRQRDFSQQGFTASGQEYRGNRYDGRRWNSGWRNDRRYDWAGWRSAHGDLFHGSYYYPPDDGYGYARVGIGAALDEAFLDEQYWIDNPAYYHLPPAYGPYRWVRYYNDCLLIDIDNGQVADVLYNVFW